MMHVDAWGVADPVTCAECGLEGCETHVGPVSPASAPARVPRLQAERALDVISAPPPTEIVEGVAWAGCLSLIVSESGAGKTFVCLSLAASLSDGLQAWLGRDVTAGSVVYCSFEGDALGRRLAALREAQGHRLDSLYVVHASSPLSPHVSREGEQASEGERDLAEALQALRDDLATQGRPPIVLLVIDTARASLAGSEDSSEHVSAYIRAVRRVMAIVPGAALVLTHHAGWQDSEDRRRRERGSSAWRGNSEAVLYLSAGNYDPLAGTTELMLEALKLRDAERPAPLRLIRRRVYLAEVDRHGQPLTSCVVERDPRTRQDREREQAQHDQAKRDALDLQALAVIANRSDITSTSKLQPHLGVRKQAVDAAVARLVQKGWIDLGERRKPYTVTATGQAMRATQ